MCLFISLYIVSFVGLEIWFLNFDRLMDADPLFFDLVRYSFSLGIIFFVFVISFHAYNVVNISEHALKEEQGKVKIAYSLLSKYVAPQLLENAMKESFFIEQIMVIGDGEKMPAAFQSLISELNAIELFTIPGINGPASVRPR